MKLKELRPILRAERVNLYLEIGTPIPYEMWGIDETKDLAEYRHYEKIDTRENDTMFLDYGEYTIEEISEDKEVPTISIFISK